MQVLGYNSRVSGLTPDFDVLGIDQLRERRYFVVFDQSIQVLRVISRRLGPSTEFECFLERRQVVELTYNFLRYIDNYIRCVSSHEQLNEC